MLPVHPLKMKVFHMSSQIPDKPITDIEYMYWAYRQCRRRKRRTHNAMVFERQLEHHLFELQKDILQKTYTLRPAVAFIIDKPKRREIFAADFRDRIVHHMIVGKLEPTWERRFIHDSYACRAGKGNLAAVRRLQYFTRLRERTAQRGSWYLQLDIASYFVSLDRNILMRRLMPTLRDDTLHYLTEQIVWQDVSRHCRIKNARREDFLALPRHKTLFHAPAHKGLPIGNLTSQFFGNVCLDALDQFVKHELKVKHYVRYCDDFVLLGDSYDELLQHERHIEAFLKTRLQLTLNPKRTMRPITEGVDFLGYIIRPDYMLPRRRVLAHLHDRLRSVDKTLRPQALMKQPTSTVLRYGYDWPTLLTVYAWLMSYYGHLKHASYHRAWQRLKADYPWLDAYFCFNDSFSIRPAWRIPPAILASSATMQIRAFVVQIPHMALLIQWGMEYLLVVGTDKGSATRVQKLAVQSIARSLLSTGVSVALIRQSATRTTRIYDRYVHSVYIPGAAAAAAGLVSLNVSLPTARQLRLL